MRDNMSKFNTNKTAEQKVRESPNATSNYEGGLAYKPSDKVKLMKMVATSLVGENKYYTKGEDHDLEIINTIRRVAKEDPEFILKLAVYTRKELKLRSVPMLLAVELANSGANPVPNSRKYITATIQRADELTEMIAYQLARNRQEPRKSKLPMLIKNGVAGAFNKFDEYQFAKYNRDGDVKLRDALFMTHPRPVNKEQQNLFNKIVNDELKTPETWETYISEHGSNRENWEYIAPLMPYFATVRNVRNFVQHNVDSDLYMGKITKPERIKGSKLFPFRFLSAYKAVQGLKGTDADQFQVKAVLDALNTAITISMDNVPKLSGRTLVLVDVSWSMKGRQISGRSQTTTYDIATLFGAMAYGLCDEAIVMAIANDISIMDSLGTDVLSNQQSLQNQENVTGIGGQTNVFKAFKYMRENNMSVDRVILLSDMQCYDSTPNDGHCDQSVAEEWAKYKQQINPKTYFYPIDLTGYGTSVVPEDDPNSNLLAGWSEQILKFIPMYEKGLGTMVDAVENYKLD
jgi:hypothetical protein